MFVSGSPVQRPHTTTHDSVSPLTLVTIGTSGDDNHNQEHETVSATTSTSSVSRTPITMTEIVKRIDDGDAKSILINKDLHYFFLKHCVVNVVTKKKWKDNCARNDYYKSITPSDEGFAFVVIDNNIERYRAMQQNTDPDYKDFTQPRYTTVTTTKGAANNVGKGWNDRGEMEF